MSDSSSLPPPSELQSYIIHAAIRYRTLLSSKAQRILDGTSVEAMEKALRRSKQSGWMEQIQLPDRKSAFTLSRKAVRHLGLSKKGLKAMGRDAVIANVAMLCYCAEKKVERLLPGEVKNSLPDLARPGLPLGNYFTDESTNPPRLTWMLVDAAKSPSVLVQKAKKAVKWAYQFSSLRELILAGQYAIVILVPNERKKWLVDRALAKRYEPHVSIGVEVVPELQSLLLS